MMTLTALFPWPLRPDLPAGAPVLGGAAVWTHAGERLTLAAHVVTEREVRASRRLAAQLLAEQLSR